LTWLPYSARGFQPQPRSKTQMLIGWVNHAGFVLHTGDLRILCDPWLEGTAFNQPDIITSSDSLLCCLATNWGGDTLAINGRYQVPPGGNPVRFFRFFRVLAYNDAGNSFTFTFLGAQAIKKIRAAVAGQEVPST
jgi:hypothetical protein